MTNNTFFSERFSKPVILTHHAIEQMEERAVDIDTLSDLLESGEVLRKDSEHLWIYKAFHGREDNMLCAAAIERNNLIVKTIMINWELSDEY
jgi:hypothetical protein